MDNVWFDDELPEGANAQGNTPWEFVMAPDHPVFSGKNSTTRTGKPEDGITQHFFTGAKQGPTIGEGDLLFAYVYLDKENPPESIQLQFNDGTWEHRATRVRTSVSEPVVITKGTDFREICPRQVNGFGWRSLRPRLV